MKLLIQDIPVRPSPATVKALQGLACADIMDALGGPPDRFTAALHRWSCPNGRLLGVAFTVTLAPGDQLVLQKALDMAQPGDVLVVQAGGADASVAVVGEIMTRLARQRGLAGFVIDGNIRDVDFIAQQDWPVFARSACPRGPGRVGLGMLNQPLRVAGMQVHAGDIVCGDSDGLVCVPRARAEEVPEAVAELMHRQDRQLSEMEAGTLDRSWVDRALASASV